MTRTLIPIEDADDVFWTLAGRCSGTEQTIAVVLALTEFFAGVARWEARNVKWVVNSIGELGVIAGGEYQFLYKGRSIIYANDNRDEDRPPLKVRAVYKREFGECAMSHFQERDRAAFDADDAWEPLPISKHPRAV